MVAREKRRKRALIAVAASLILMILLLSSLRRDRVSELLEQLRDRDEGVRQKAARALGRIGDERAVEPLINALEDKDASVCWYVAEALKRITGRDFGADYDIWLKWLKE